MSDQKIPDETSRSYSFVRFARQPFYRAVNAHLVDISDFKPGGAILDLACGTGEITRLILKKLHGVRNTLIIAMDASSNALEQARKELSEFKGSMIQFVQGQAEQLSQTLKNHVDAVIFCNAIHMLEDKHKVLNEIYQVLNPGGILAFNSTFFDGSQLPETETFYRRWMSKALRLLKRKHGLLPARDVKVASRRQLSPQEYEELLRQEGFVIQLRQLEPVGVTLEGWLGISEFSDFIQGALPGVPLAAASDALQEAVKQVFAEMELESVPRLWLHVVAARPATT